MNRIDLRIRPTLLIFVIGLIQSSRILADPVSWNQEAQISYGTDSAQFGATVAAQGDRILVGALQGDGVVADSGAAYIYERSAGSWNRVATLAANDGTQFANFGGAVSLDNNRAVVGARDASRPGLQYAGSAYVYDAVGSSWTQSARLSAQDAMASDSFGAAVSLLGNRVVVGATKDDYSTFSDAGSAYVFDRDSNGNWLQSAKLTPLDPQSDAEFGFSAAQLIGEAVIGAPYLSLPNSYRNGAVYVFDEHATSWDQTARLTASDAGFDDRFGYSVAMSGDRMIIGAPDASLPGGQRAGAAYIFDKLNGIWTETAKLIEPIVNADDNFGFSVALDGDRAIIGSPVYTTATGSKGAAFVFDLVDGSWQNTAMVTASDATSNDAFGEAVAVTGTRAVVGARLADTLAGTNAGAAYVYSIPEPTGAALATIGLTLFAVFGSCRRLSIYAAK